MTQPKAPPLFTPGQRLDAVVTIETSQGRKHHHRFGAAFINPNGTIGVVLNSLPFERSFRLLPSTPASPSPADATTPADAAPPPDAAARTDPADSPQRPSPSPPRRRSPLSRDEG